MANTAPRRAWPFKPELSAWTGPLTAYLHVAGYIGPFVACRLTDEPLRASERPAQRTRKNITSRVTAGQDSVIVCPGRLLRARDQIVWHIGAAMGPSQVTQCVREGAETLLSSMLRRDVRDTGDWYSASSSQFYEGSEQELYIEMISVDTSTNCGYL